MYYLALATVAGIILVYYIALATVTGISSSSYVALAIYTYVHYLSNNLNHLRCLFCFHPSLFRRPLFVPRGLLPQASSVSRH